MVVCRCGQFGFLLLFMCSRLVSVVVIVCWCMVLWLLLNWQCLLISCLLLVQVSQIVFIGFFGELLLGLVILFIVIVKCVLLCCWVLCIMVLIIFWLIVLIVGNSDLGIFSWRVFWWFEQVMQLVLNQFEFFGMWVIVLVMLLLVQDFVVLICLFR